MPRAGSRERRRKAAIVRRLEAGEPPEAFETKTRDKYPELFAPYLGRRVAALLRTSRSVSRSRSRATSVTRDVSPSRPPSPPPNPRIPIALDLHNVLDQGVPFDPRRPIPDSSIAAVRKLLDFRFVPWILTWIGSQGAQSQQRRIRAEASREYIASQLGLELAKGSWPRPEGIFLKITDFKTGVGGKAHFCGQLRTFIILDDNFDICQDCESCGVLAFQILGGRKTKRYIPRNWVDPRAQPCNTFPEAVDYICSLFHSDRGSVELQTALESCWARRNIHQSWTLREESGFQ